jgi:ABC-2 type transport system ATP-binding protein
MVMIEVKNLEKNLKGKKGSILIKDVTFELENGNVLGIIGSEISGRYTLMKLLAGIVKQNKGNILIDKVELNKSKRYKKDLIGYVPLHFINYENLKVIEFFEYYAGLFKVKKKDQKDLIEEILKVLGLKEFSNLYLDNLSNYQLKLVNLGRALLNSPRLLILEDFFFGLDESSKLKLKDIFEKLKTLNLVILISSESIDKYIENVCTHYLILKNGEQDFFGAKDSYFCDSKYNNIEIINIKSNDNFKLFKILKEEESVSGITICVSRLEFEYNNEKKDISEFLDSVTDKDITIKKFSKRKFREGIAKGE